MNWPENHFCHDHQITIGRQLNSNCLSEPKLICQLAQRGWIIFETEKRGNFLYSTLYKIIQDLSQCFKKYKNVSFEFRSSIARKNCLASASSVHSFCQLGCSLKYNPFMKIYNTQNTSTKLADYYEIGKTTDSYF